MRWTFWETKINHKHASATPKLPTQSIVPNIFSSFYMGAFGLANPCSLLLFWLQSYLNLPLFLPRAQISLLSAFASLPNYFSTKIELFGRIYSQSSKTRNLNMKWSRLRCLAIHQLWQELTNCTQWDTLKSLDSTEAEDGPVNGQMLKHYFDLVCWYVRTLTCT